MLEINLGNSTICNAVIIIKLFAFEDMSDDVMAKPMWV